MTLDCSLSDEALIGRLYEAALVPDAWPSLLQSVADRVGAVGAVLLVRDPHIVTLIASPCVEQHIADYIEGGWANDVTHAAALVADRYPGFRTEADYHSAEEIARMPVHAEFFDPRGFVSGAGTVFQGPADDMLQVTIEGFPSHRAAAAAVPFLDQLRPHLGRAVSLTAHARRMAADRLVQALAVVGLGAAILDTGGRLRATNDRFAKRMGNRMTERNRRIVFTDRHLGERISAALAAPSQGIVRSFAMIATEDQPAFAIHVLALEGRARERAESDGALLLLAEPANATMPNADLLGLMFDLTPAEARLTRLLVEGHTLAAAASICGIVKSTVRAQLKAVFGKTGVTRQADLIRLLAGLGAPWAGDRFP